MSLVISWLEFDRLHEQGRMYSLDDSEWVLGSSNSALQCSFSRMGFERSDVWGVAVDQIMSQVYASAARDFCAVLHTAN